MYGCVPPALVITLSTAVAVDEWATGSHIGWRPECSLERRGEEMETIWWSHYSFNSSSDIAMTLGVARDTDKQAHEETDTQTKRGDSTVTSQIGLTTQ